MSKAIKLLICGFESTGKSTIGAKIDKALVVNFDRKEYAFKVPHCNIKSYTGLDAVTDTITEKVQAYEAKMGHYPNTIVLDTVTQMYSAMQKFNDSKYNGFDIHKNNNMDTLGLNDFIEDTLIANGMSVVIVAHTVYDEASGRHIIPATGAFAKAGSFLSVVNNSVFIEKKANKRVVNHTVMKFPCRSTLEDIPEYEDMDKYDVNKHIAQLKEQKLESDDFLL